MKRMSSYLKRTWAEIDLDAIRHNYLTIASSLSAGCRAMAIVKADAYGHGAAYIARVLRDAGASWFGVSNIEEALQLRESGIESSILILSYTPPEEAARLADYHITQSISSREYGEQLHREAVKAGVTVGAHIKVDTGMSRIGFSCQHPQDILKAADDIEAVCSLPGLKADGIFTHFASADEQKDGGYTAWQFDNFQQILHKLEERGLRFSLRHCCNSAATMLHPEMHLDMVRPGIILYGLLPAPWMKGLLPLSPAMELKSVVSMVKTVPKDTKVSYGRTFTASKTTTLATVPIGYADGFARSFSNRAAMLVNGKPAKVVGRVCMDQCMLDVTGIDGVREGMTVTVFGHDGRAFLPVEAISDLSETINYETVCLVGKRVPRVYLKNQQVIGQLNYIVPEMTDIRQA